MQGVGGRSFSERGQDLRRPFCRQQAWPVRGMQEQWGAAGEGGPGSAQGRRQEGTQGWVGGLADLLQRLHSLLVLTGGGTSPYCPRHVG